MGKGIENLPQFRLVWRIERAVLEGRNLWKNVDLMVYSICRRLLFIAALSGQFFLMSLSQGLSGSVDLTIKYDVSIFGLSVGSAKVNAKLDDGKYTISGSGKVVGISSLISDGRGKVNVTGTIANREISPIHYSQIIIEDERETLDMTFSEGRVSDISVTPTKEEKRLRRLAKRKGKKKRKKGKNKKKAKRNIPLEDEHRVGVLDPLSPFLVPVENLDDSESVCRRRVPLFDGEHRFDVVFKLKKVKKQNGSKIFICSAAYQPIAGYRPEDKSVKFMVNNKKMEVWLSPAGSSGLVVPVEAYIDTEIGMLVVKASDIKLRQ